MRKPPKPRSKKSKKRNAPAHNLPLTLSESPDRESYFGRSFAWWIGSCTATLTLFGALQTILDLSKWAHFIVVRWNGIIRTFWQYIFGLFGLPLVKEAAGPLTFFLSLNLISFGTMALDHKDTAEKPPPIFSLENLFRLFTGLAIGILSMFVFWFLMEIFVMKEPIANATGQLPQGRLWSGISILLILSYLTLSHSFKTFFDYLILGVFVGLFYFVICLPAAQEAASGGAHQIEIYRKAVLETSVVMFPMQMMSLLTVTPPRRLNQRFLLITLIFLSLLLLNYLSRLGLSADAPTV